MNVRKLRLLMMAMSLTWMGCRSPEPLPPATERFFFVAEGLDGPTRQTVYQAVTHTIGHVARPGEYVTIVSTPSHTPIATVCVPAGSTKTRLRKPAIRHEVRAIAELFEQDGAGQSLQAEAPKIASTVRSLRRTNLPVRVVVVADPVYRNECFETWSMEEGKVPCDGAVAEDYSPWRVVQTLPEGTSVGWLTPDATFGDELFHQEAITRWYRRYLLAAGGSLDCFTSDPALAFDYQASQFTDPLDELDDATGMRRVTGVADTQPIELTPTPAEPLLEATAAVKPVGAPSSDVYDAPPSALEELRGDLRYVALLKDDSLSIVQDQEGNPNLSVHAALLGDMTETLQNIPSEKFSVIGFGGRGEEGDQVRLDHYPWSFWGPAWSDATPENRKAACRTIANWESAGGTSTYAALKEARRLKGLTGIVLWSDGLPSISETDDAQQEVLDLVAELAAEGVVINTIGVGNLSARGGGTLDLEGAQFLKQIADLTGGAYMAL